MPEKKRLPKIEISQKVMFIQYSIIISSKGCQAFSAIFSRKCRETDGVLNLGLRVLALLVSVTMSLTANTTQKLKFKDLTSPIESCKSSVSFNSHSIFDRYRLPYPDDMGNSCSFLDGVARSG